MLHTHTHTHANRCKKISLSLSHTHTLSLSTHTHTNARARQQLQENLTLSLLSLSLSLSLSQPLAREESRAQDGNQMASARIARPRQWDTCSGSQKSLVSSSRALLINSAWHKILRTRLILNIKSLCVNDVAFEGKKQLVIAASWISTYNQGGGGGGGRGNNAWRSTSTMEKQQAGSDANRGAHRYCV